MTAEDGIPSVGAVGVCPPDADQPALAGSAGAPLDPEQAARGALCELGPILTDLIGRHPGIADGSRAMVADSSLVTTMDDHSVLYANHQASSRLEFLTAS